LALIRPPVIAFGKEVVWPPALRGLDDAVIVIGFSEILIGGFDDARGMVATLNFGCPGARQNGLQENKSNRERRHTTGSAAPCPALVRSTN
jgi:hypothetical protein